MKKWRVSDWRVSGRKNRRALGPAGEARRTMIETPGSAASRILPIATKGVRKQKEEGRSFSTLSPRRFDFFKNEATDSLDNKGSAFGEIRNEATEAVLSFQSSVLRLYSPGWGGN